MTGNPLSCSLVSFISLYSVLSRLLVLFSSHLSESCLVDLNILCDLVCCFDIVLILSYSLLAFSLASISSLSLLSHSCLHDLLIMLCSLLRSCFVLFSPVWILSRWYLFPLPSSSRVSLVLISSWSRLVLVLFFSSLSSSSLLTGTRHSYGGFT